MFFKINLTITELHVDVSFVIQFNVGIKLVVQFSNNGIIEIDDTVKYC